MKNELLTLLKKADGYLSGQELGNQLGVSRAAVWKTIETMRKEGYLIEAVTNKGYKLLDSGDLLNAGDVRYFLKTKTIGCEIKLIDIVDSTNNYLRTLAFQGCPEGTVVIAHAQKGGKGRRGKAWSSPAGEGLWMSFMIKPVVEPAEAAKITLVTGLSVCEALRTLGYDASIKWPNDIILENKKVCGILAEMTGQVGSLDFIIVGIGVNVSMSEFAGELKDVAVSLKMVDGKGVQRSVLAAAILNRFEENYNRYLNEGFQSVKENYETLCITLNKEVEVIGKNGFRGRAAGISPEGELVVLKENGEQVVVYSGEVSVRGVL